MRLPRLPVVLAALTVTALSLGVLPSTTAGAAGGAGQPSRAYVTGWLPYWIPDTATDSVVNHAAVFDDASPFVFDVQSATNIDLKIAASQWRTMRSRLRGAGVDIIPTIATDMSADKFASILSSKSRRKAHVAELASLANRYDVDGLDLDYESINFGSASAKRTVRELYPVLVQELASRLHESGKLLSVTVASRTSRSDPNWMVYDYLALGAAADRIRIMTYDLHWSGGSPGPIAPKWWVEDVLSFAVSEIDPLKVSFGLPAYGRDWFVKSISGSCPASARATVSRSTRDMQHFARTRGINPHWNDRGTSRTFTYTQTYSAGGHRCRAKRAVWFDDARSVAEKIRLVQKYELRGVAMWALGYESQAMWDRLGTYGRKIAVRQPNLSLRAPASINFGESGSVSVKVRDGERAVPGKSVTLQRRPVGTTGWLNVASARSDAKGRARFAVKPQRHVAWRVHTNRDWLYASNSTSPVVTRVAFGVSVSDAPRVVARGSRWSLSGSVRPASARPTVVRQKYVGGVWIDKASQQAARDGTFTFRLHSRVSGEHAYRVVALSDVLDRGTSRTVHISVG